MELFPLLLILSHNSGRVGTLGLVFLLRGGAQVVALTEMIPLTGKDNHPDRIIGHGFLKSTVQLFQ